MVCSEAEVSDDTSLVANVAKPEGEEEIGSNEEGEEGDEEGVKNKNEDEDERHPAYIPRKVGRLIVYL